MTATSVLDLKGKKVRELTINDEVFAVDPGTGLVHRALVRQLANGRSGSANTKTKSEVRGGGRKPWRQKGTGRARAGSRRSPLWEGGGVTFGPKPRDFSLGMPRKMRVLAVRSALAARSENFVVVSDFKEFKEAKTKAAVEIFRDLKIDTKKVLVVLDHVREENNRFSLAARNLANVRVIQINNLNVKDILGCEAVLTNESTMKELIARFTPKAGDASKVVFRKANLTKVDAKASKSSVSKVAGAVKIKAAAIAEGEPKTVQKATKMEPAYVDAKASQEKSHEEPTKKSEVTRKQELAKAKPVVEAKKAAPKSDKPSAKSGDNKSKKNTK